MLFSGRIDPAHGSAADRTGADAVRLPGVILLGAGIGVRSQLVVGSLAAGIAEPCLVLFVITACVVYRTGFRKFLRAFCRMGMGKGRIFRCAYHPCGA